MKENNKYTENNFRLSDEKLKNVVTFGMILLTEYIINVVFSSSIYCKLGA